MNKEVLTTFEAADFCHTSYMSVKRWIWSGKLSAFKTPGGHFRIKRSDLVDFMRKNDMPVSDDEPAVRKRVLIVDDDEMAREGMANYFRMNSAELEVATAGDGYDAGIMVSQFRPDIILLNLMMSGLDGFSVCERLKKSPMTRDIRIVVMTGKGNEDAIQRAQASGVDRVVFTPVEMGSLFEQIRALMV